MRKDDMWNPKDGEPVVLNSYGMGDCELLKCAHSVGNILEKIQVIQALKEICMDEENILANVESLIIYLQGAQQ